MWISARGESVVEEVKVGAQYQVDGWHIQEWVPNLPQTPVPLGLGLEESALDRVRVPVIICDRRLKAEVRWVVGAKVVIHTRCPQLDFGICAYGLAATQPFVQ